MNLNVNDNPLLVAPRPVRLSAFTRSLRIAPPPSDEAENVDDSKHVSRIHSVQPPDKDVSSPRASPRSSLPSEALEEFLSILRPAIFPPSSPVLRPRRNGALSLPTFGVAYKAKSKIDSFSKSEHSVSGSPEDIDPQRQTPTYTPEPISDHLPGNWDFFGSEITSRWHAQVLASPISRMQTRNPFPRHAAHDITLPPIRSSPTISPATIPLPAPSPDESLEVF